MQFGEQARIGLSVLKAAEGSVVEHIVLIIAAQHRQEIEPRLGWAGVERGKVFSTNMCRVAGTAGMARTDVINSDKRGRYQPGVENGRILFDEAVQSLCQQTHDLTLGDIDADIVEECCQAFGCYPIRLTNSVDSIVSIATTIGSGWLISHRPILPLEADQRALQFWIRLSA